MKKMTLKTERIAVKTIAVSYGLLVLAILLKALFARGYSELGFELGTYGLCFVSAYLHALLTKWNLEDRESFFSKPRVLVGHLLFAIFMVAVALKISIFWALLTMPAFYIVAVFVGEKFVSVMQKILGLK